jgi:DNA-binding PadR family transcriptional regulator
MARRPNSSLQTLKLLEALMERPNEWHYGYDLSKATSLKSGTLYPQLIRLESSAWLEARWEEARQPGKPARHMYRLTDRGVFEAQSVVTARRPLASRQLEATS